MIVVSIEASLGFCEVEGSRIDRDVVVASDEPVIVFVEMKLLPIVAGTLGSRYN